MSGKKGLTTAKTRSGLYRVARLLGDADSVRKGKAGQRLGRRTAGKLGGRALGQLFR